MPSRHESNLILRNWHARGKSRPCKNNSAGYVVGMDEQPKRKPGRPAARAQTAVIQVYATPNELAALDEARERRPRSDVMREALSEWLRKLRKP